MGWIARRWAALSTLAAVILVSGVLPATALSPIKVVGGPGNEYGASSNAVYLTWTSCAKHCNLYVKELPDGAPKRVNPRGTGAENGYFIGTSNVLVYNQWSDRYRSDIFFYDVTTGSRTRAPLAVSRPKTWEWAPVATDDYVAFMRVKRSSSGELLDKRLLLYDRHSGELRTLISGLRREYGPSFAGSQFVLMWRCDADYVVCELLYWSEATGRHVQPSPTGHNQSPAAIDETTGDLYFMRARPGCGRRATFRRGSIGTTVSTLVSSLPDGMDVSSVSLARNGSTGDLDLYFTGWHGRSASGDIYVLRGVDTV